MRVLFITGEFPPMQGGVGDCTNEIAQALTRVGVETAVLTSTVKSQDAQVTSPSGLGPDSNLRASGGTAVQIYPIVPQWDWSALQLIRHALGVTRADIMHIQYQTGAFGMHPMIDFAPTLLNLYPFAPSPRGRGGWGARSVVTFHDLRVPYLFPKAGRLRDWVTNRLARSSDAVIATNGDDCVKLAALNLKHLTVIPIGSNVKPAPPSDYDRARWRKGLGVTPSEILLCYFGFLNASKGGETLIHALAELPNAKLVMVGGQVGASDPTNIAYLARVKQLIDQLNLTPRVIWTDYIPQEKVSANMLAADICVLPYRDGASFRRGSFMAALAHGLPIVTTEPTPTQGEGLGVSLKSGENVMLVPPDDPPAIVSAITRLAADDALRAKLSAGALAAAEFFTWDKIAVRHLELYQQLLDS